MLGSSLVKEHGSLKSRHQIELTNNVLNFKDGLFDNIWITQSTEYLTASLLGKINVLSRVDRPVLFSTEFRVSSVETIIEKRFFSMMDLIIGIAGVAELLINVFGVLINPFSEFNFKISAMQKLFLVRTKDTEFETPTEEPFDMIDENH